MKTNIESLTEKLEAAKTWPASETLAVVIDRASRLLDGRLAPRKSGYAWYVTESGFESDGNMGSAEAAKNWAAASLLCSLNDLAPSPMCKAEPFGAGGDINKFARGGSL
jgi:hypothetical protein